MDESGFWRIVDESRKVAPGDHEQQLEAMRAVLQRLESTELIDFQKHIDALIDRAYTWELWGAAYTIQGGCGDDGFEYFRRWLISCGKATYERALGDPDTLAELPELVGADDPAELTEFESLAWVAPEVYEQKMGQDFPYPAHEGRPEPTGQEWDEDSDDLRARFPRLWARFGDA